MLAGRAPFEGEFAAVLAQHLSQPPPPLRDFCGDVPEEINALISTMLVKQPERRVQLSGVIGVLSATAESA